MTQKNPRPRKRPAAAEASVAEVKGLDALDAHNFFSTGRVPPSSGRLNSTAQDEYRDAAMKELQDLFDRSAGLTQAAGHFVRGAVHQTDVSEDDGSYLPAEGYDAFIKAVEATSEIAMLGVMAKFLGLDKERVDVVMQERLRSLMLPGWYFKMTSGAAASPPSPPSKEKKKS